MTTPTKLWMYLCAIAIWSGGWWYGGYHTADAAWTQSDTERKLADLALANTNRALQMLSRASMAIKQVDDEAGLLAVQNTKLLK